jgi:hypothetical protein
MRKLNHKSEEVLTIEAKHIFIDIVSYTHNRSVEAQTDLISYLNRFVKETLEEFEIKPENRIYIPTGDGMCISLLNVSTPYDVHILISLGILEKIHSHNINQDDTMRQFDIRIGINENIDNLITDINGNRNISGSGINHAARIEGLADPSQILIGISVHDKLVQREKYMYSFSKFSAEVKHELPLTVYQYTNERLDYLNSEIPSKFRYVPVPQKIFTLSNIQAYYIANCIVYEDFITKNVDASYKTYSMHIIVVQLSQDSEAKTIIKKTASQRPLNVKRPLQEHFDYIQTVDFGLITELDRYYCERYLDDIRECFSEPYLIVNDTGKKKLFEHYPEIYEEFNIQ